MENITDDFIIDTNLDDDSDELYSEENRLFDLREQLSEELIVSNIIEAFEQKDSIRPNMNYIKILIDNYNAIKSRDNKYECDNAYINDIVLKIANKFTELLRENFGVALSTDITMDNMINLDKYLERLETLYEFFIVRRSENISDYLINKIFTDRDAVYERYKNKLTPKDQADLFYGINKKKYHSAGGAAFLQFLDDAIGDFISEVDDAYTLFNNIINLDIFEYYNNNMNDILNDFIDNLVYIDTSSEIIKKYFSIINNKESYAELRANIYLEYVRLTPINDNTELLFNKDSKLNDSLLKQSATDTESAENKDEN